MKLGPTLVTGGTGFVGANLARLLLEKGLRVKALARKGASRKNLEGLAVDVVEGDLLDEASLRRGCAGARFAFHVAADYRIWVPDPSAMKSSHPIGRIVLTAARSNSIRYNRVQCGRVALGTFFGGLSG